MSERYILTLYLDCSRRWVTINYVVKNTAVLTCSDIQQLFHNVLHFLGGVANVCEWFMVFVVFDDVSFPVFFVVFHYLPVS